MVTGTSLYLLTFYRRTDTVSVCATVTAFGTETADSSVSTSLCLGGQETGAGLTTVCHAWYLRIIVSLKCVPATIHACLVSGCYVGKWSFKRVVLGGY